MQCCCSFLLMLPLCPSGLGWLALQPLSPTRTSIPLSSTHARTQMSSRAPVTRHHPCFHPQPAALSPCNSLGSPHGLGHGTGLLKDRGKDPRDNLISPHYPEKARKVREMTDLFESVTEACPAVLISPTRICFCPLSASLTNLSCGGYETGVDKATWGRFPKTARE